MRGVDSPEPAGRGAVVRVLQYVEMRTYVGTRSNAKRLLATRVH